ncbi:MAG: DNA alkylation repair protein [Campylobacterales bacterium]|nr:DNA alkylation repair protein [Campylobacterales bacterium]
MATLLKDLYNKKYVELLANSLQALDKTFSSKQFYADVFDTFWKEKELKARMTHLALCLHKNLTENYVQNIEILTATFAQMNYAYSLENMLFSTYVGIYGKNDFKLSMQALQAFTINSSSEFAIREFLLLYEKETLKEIQKWVSHENEHIRRLASEGCRPRLPWALSLPNFKKDPTPILEILEALKNDTSPYVRKSVANALNDISKDNPEITLLIAKRWLQEEVNESLIKHGCRTLLKSSNTDALSLFGYRAKQSLILTELIFASEVQMGQDLEFSFKLSDNHTLGHLRIEFALHLLRKNGNYNTKVFQIAQKEYNTQSIELKKSYSFKKITTRNYYTGEQAISIIVNGLVLTKFFFTLHD